MSAAGGARRLGALLPALVGWGWVEALSSLQQRDQRALHAEQRDQRALHAERRDQPLWKGGFDGSICKYPTASEGLACALASPGGSGA